MNTTDINKEDESLEDAAEKVYPIKNTMNPFYAGNNGFKLGANWQSEKDKVIIDKLIDIAKRVKFMFGNINQYPESTIGYRLATDAKEILNEIDFEERKSESK